MTATTISFDSDQPAEARREGTTRAVRNDTPHFDEARFYLHRRLRSPYRRIDVEEMRKGVLTSKWNARAANRRADASVPRR